MTTFNIRSKEPEEAFGVVKSMLGEVRRTGAIAIEDGRSTLMIAIDTAPAGVEPHRGGTRGAMRGTRRGAF